MADPYLSVAEAGGERRVTLAPASMCLLGRAASNDVVLADTGASRQHAMIRRDGDGACTLVDSGSRNGTLLNGRPVTVPARLADGDEVAIGAQRLRFVDPDARAPDAAPAARRAAVEETMFVAQQSLITVLVIDVRGFTPLSREIGEERLSAVMTTIFREAGRLLEATRCWSQKFIGDAVLGVWRHEHDRLLSFELGGILDTVVALEALFAALPARFDLPRPLRFGGAINTGLASIGNMGSGSSADFTALGDTVNKTFRLETASKDLAADLVIGEATFRSLAPPLHPDLLPPPAEVALKGYDAAQPVRLLRFADIPAFARAVTG